MPAAPALPRLPAPSGMRRRTALGAALAALAAPAWAAKARKGGASLKRPLRAGQALWLPDVAPAGPVTAAVNLYTQHVQLYRNGIAIGYSSISSGRTGYATPTGLFNVLQKRRHHRSNKYDDAPMPWMVRLTWDGIAFHGGALPGYPASHGCIRLPMHFAPRFFGAIRYNDNVLVVRQSISEGQQPLTALSPIDPQGSPLVLGGMLQGDPWWAPAPEPAPQETPQETPPEAPLDAALAASEPPEPPEPLALLASISQQRLFVLRAGRVLAAAPLPEGAFDTVHTVLGGCRLLLWNAEEDRWAVVGRAEKNPYAIDDAVWRDALSPGDFAARLHALLVPGSTLLLSDLAAVGDVHAAAWEATDKRFFYQTHDS